MFILRIEHPVPDFENWRKAFDNDPIGRKKSGVTQYRIYRPVDNTRFASIELEFQTKQEAENALDALKRLWKNVEGKVMMDPATSISELIESTTL